MARNPRSDLEALLETLGAARIEFIVVGGVAGVLLGAPLTTQDLDIVPRQEKNNLERLFQALQKLDATFREPTGRRLRPTREHLAGPGQLRLLTRLGALDVLGRLHDGRGYDELLENTVTLREGSLRVRVVDLETLIEIKSSTGRAQDRLALAVLVALRREQRK